MWMAPSKQRSLQMLALHMPVALGHWALELGVKFWELPSFQVLVSCSTFAMSSAGCLPSTFFPWSTLASGALFTPWSSSGQVHLFCNSCLIFFLLASSLCSRGYTKVPANSSFQSADTIHLGGWPHFSPLLFSMHCTLLLQVWPCMVCWVGKKVSHRALPSKSTQLVPRWVGEWELNEHCAVHEPKAVDTAIMGISKRVGSPCLG